MNTLIFGLLTIISVFIFMKLGKIKASKKQLNRNDRINWARNKQPNFDAENYSTKIPEKKNKQINDQSEK